jgi:hypothetical protein
LPKLNAWLLVPCAWRMKKAMKRTTMTTGTRVVRISTIQPVSAGFWTV